MRVVKPATIEPWTTEGEPKTLATARHIELYLQNFRDPLTQKTHEFSLYRSPDWCSVCALTPEGTLLLVRQYKQGIDGIFYEFCAGVIDAGEQPAETARRELAEETGYAAEALRELGAAWISPRRSAVKFHAFIATNCRPAGDQQLDDIEAIEVVEVTPEEFWALVKTQEIRDAHTLVNALHAVREGYLPPPL